MAESEQTNTAFWVTLLVVGMMLNTIGIALRDIGVIRYLLMGTGLLLLLICVVGLLKAQQKPDSRE